MARANSAGETPLHTAAACGQLGVAQQLIRLNASIEAECSLGWTALHHAAANGRSSICSIVVAPLIF